MRTRLLVAVTAAALIAGCEQQAAAPNEVAAINEVAPATASAERTNAVLGAAVSGDQAKALMDERHEGMEEIGDAFKAVNVQLKGSSPDIAAIQKDAATIATLAEKSIGWTW